MLFTSWQSPKIEVFSPLFFLRKIHLKIVCNISVKCYNRLKVTFWRFSFLLLIHIYLYTFAILDINFTINDVHAHLPLYIHVSYLYIIYIYIPVITSLHDNWVQGKFKNISDNDNITILKEHDKLSKYR